MLHSGVGEMEVDFGRDDEYDDLTMATAIPSTVTPIKQKMSMLDKTLLSSNETTKQDASVREDFLFHSNTYKKKEILIILKMPCNGRLR